MKPDTKSLCLYYGGSTLYHLQTPESDLDERGVFMHVDPAYILGTKRFDEERVQPVNGAEDKVLKELSHFCSLVKRSNSEAMEVLFCKSSEFQHLSPEFEKFRKLKYSFVSSTALFNCLRGYMIGERKLANGERKGKIGGKRYAKLQEVGYSPKNAVQLMRLAQVGITFFIENEYVVDTRDFSDCKSVVLPPEIGNLSNLSFHEFLMTVKTEPQRISKDDLSLFFDFYEKKLVDAFEHRRVTYNFDEGLMNELLLEIYFPILEKNYNYQP